jgi:hypothetical protein
MRPRVVQATAVGAALLACVASSRFAPQINEERRALSLIGTENPMESAPPEYAFAIQAFGAFRGLLTNIAFIRAEEYKMQGKYYDAMQLASWITKLQPRFVGVWEFLSWNMAWNISVTTYTPEERWNWVYSGVKLLRDEGITKYNPRAINLYKQLAWIFVNKMSESTDEHHLTYKRNWAWRMHLVLGPPGDPLGEFTPGETLESLDAYVGRAGTDRLAEATAKERERRDAALRAKRAAATGEPVQPAPPPPASAPSDFVGIDGYEIVKKAAYEHMREIADAPATLRQLYEQHPDALSKIDALREIGVRLSDDKLSEDDYWNERGLAFTFFLPVRILLDPPSLLSRLLKSPEEFAPAVDALKLDEILGLRAGDPTGLAILRWMQRKTLAEVYKLHADRMANLTEIFGPMDWRVVDAHSLYWVNEGLIAGSETISNFKNDRTNTTRLIFFSLRNLYFRNRLVFEPYPQNVNVSYINFTTDLNFIEPLHQAYLRYGKDIDPDPTEKGVGETFRTGHTNFLIESIRVLYFAGRKREAQRYYDYIRDNYAIQGDGTINPAFSLTLDDFVPTTWNEAIGTWAQVRAAVDNSLGQAFDALSEGSIERAASMSRFAREVHKNYIDSLPDLDEQHKLRLVPFQDYEADVLRTWFRTAPFSPFVTLRKARLWSALPLTLKLAIYDDVAEIFKVECERVEFDLAKAFPEPPGLEEYRKANPRRGPQEVDKPVNTPAQQLN